MLFFKKRYTEDEVAIIAQNAAQKVMNASTLRKGDPFNRTGVSADGDRDLNAIFKYNVNPGFKDFLDNYMRIGYAKTVINRMARSCWRDVPKILDAEPKKDVPEEDIKSLLPEQMLALKEAGMFDALERADKLQRIGNFSVLYVAVPGKPHEPLTKSNGRIEDVRFIPYSQDSVQVNKFINDPASPRHKMPEEYTLTRKGDDTDTSGLNNNVEPIKVHWTRVVHMAEGALENPLWGIPELSAIFDALYDYMKSRGSGGESALRNSMRAFTIELDKDVDLSKKATGSTQTHLERLAKKAEEFINKARNFLIIGGGTIKQMSTDVPDLRPSVEVEVDEFAAGSETPLRILTGKGGGTLLGNEDKASWNQNVADRREQYCSPWFIRTLRIIELAGLIKLPKNVFTHWPVPRATDDKTESEVRKNNAQAELWEAQAKTMLSVTGDDGPPAEDIPAEDLTDS